MRIHPIISTLLFALAVSNAALAQSFHSTDRQTNLIELYTSEGCSSCPPADKWFRSLRHRPGLWTDFIPLAFHVDYWDYIGWKDPFAKPRYTQRQYQYHHANTLRSIYTPGVLINGQEWRAWRRSDLPEDQANNAGKLSISIDDGKLSAEYQTDIPISQTMVLNIALLGFDLKSNVQKGENTGRTLQHDFVVLGYRTVAMQPNTKGFYTHSTELPAILSRKHATGIAAWINSPRKPQPLQATGGWLN
jgi:hypothetical protein